jgi:hypothetical protein
VHLPELGFLFVLAQLLPILMFFVRSLCPLSDVLSDCCRQHKRILHPKHDRLIILPPVLPSTAMMRRPPLLPAIRPFPIITATTLPFSSQGSSSNGGGGGIRSCS